MPPVPGPAAGAVAGAASSASAHAGDGRRRIAPECRRAPGRQPALHAIVRDTAHMLHVTNGDSAVAELRAAGHRGRHPPLARRAARGTGARRPRRRRELRAERAGSSPRGWAPRRRRSPTWPPRRAAGPGDRRRRAGRPVVRERPLRRAPARADRRPRPGGRRGELVLVGVDGSAASSSSRARRSAPRAPAPFDPGRRTARSGDAFTRARTRAGSHALDAPPVVRDAAPPPAEAVPVDDRRPQPQRARAAAGRG